MDSTKWRVRRSTNNDVLCHKAHKYVARVEIGVGPNGRGTRYRYFYDEKEYQSYLKTKKKSITDGLKSVFKSVSTFVKNGVSYLTSKKKQLVKKLTSDPKRINKGANYVAKTMSNLATKESVRKYKYEKKVKTPDGKTRYFYNSESYNRYLKRLEYEKNEPDYLKRLPKSSYDDELDSKENISKVNEGFNSKTKVVNSVESALAYELRMRGYDVQAREVERTKTNHRIEDASRAVDVYKGFNNPKVLALAGEVNTERTVDVSEIIKETPKTSSALATKKLLQSLRDKDSSIINNTSQSVLKEYIKAKSPENSRGVVTFMNGYGEGINVVYEIDKSGDVTLADPATNGNGISIDHLCENSCAIVFARTDNLQVNRRVMRNVEPRTVKSSSLR